MKKEEFIAELASEIRDLSKEDIARSLEYYGEMIDERVEDGMSVDEAVAALGGVETVARQIMEEMPRERRAFGEATDENLGRRISREVNAWVEKTVTDAMDQTKKAWTYHAPTPEAPEDGTDADFMTGAEAGGEGEREYTISEPFDAVDVQVCSADVRVMRSRDGETHVVTERDDHVRETVAVRGGTLVVLQEPGKQPGRSGTFFGINFNFGFSDGGRVELYLADRLWERIAVRTVNGDVEAEDVRASALSLRTKSGDIDARHLTVEGVLEAESMSGDVELSTVTAGGIELHTASGDLELDETEAGNVSLGSKSGDLSLEKTVAHGTLAAESISGDVSLQRCDAQELHLRSVSGDVDGTLLTPKRFAVRSVSGDVKVAPSDPGAGECEAQTVSGDISLRLAP